MFDLAARSLYLCVGAREDMASFLPQVLRGGVDVVQLREKNLPDEVRIAQARIMVPICRDFAVPFIMNDSAELALTVGADGVHVGQDDAPVSLCRRILGPEAIIGLSTHAPSELAQAHDEDVTYLSAGPITATPTKPGRAGTGIDYAAGAQRSTSRPVFVTGGVTPESIPALVAAGLEHFVVVRYLTDAADPRRCAREVRRSIDESLSAAN